MTTVLESILASGTVTDGRQSYPLRHPDHPHLPVAVDSNEGSLLQEIVRAVGPKTSLEIGFAYGVSTLYICETLAELGQPARHIVMDPHQSTQWRGIGLRNVREAGFGGLVDFREQRSELVLPDLLREGVSLDFALIDGWHTFDQVLLEFYFINRMLRVGGVVAFDDADRRSINRVIRHALTYPAYRVFELRPRPRPAVSLAGRLRRRLGGIPGAERVLRHDFLHRDWDLGVLGSCIAIQKVAEDARSSGWDRHF